MKTVDETADQIAAAARTHPIGGTKPPFTPKPSREQAKESREQMGQYGELVAKAARDGRLSPADIEQLSVICETQKIDAERLRASIKHAGANRRTSAPMRRGF